MSPLICESVSPLVGITAARNHGFTPSSAFSASLRGNLFLPPRSSRGKLFSFLFPRREAKDAERSPKCFVDCAQSTKRGNLLSFLSLRSLRLCEATSFSAFSASLRGYRLPTTAYRLPITDSPDTSAHVGHSIMGADVPVVEHMPAVIKDGWGGHQRQ